jgi:flagellar basal body P-ring formation protein FlgA
VTVWFPTVLTATALQAQTGELPWAEAASLEDVVRRDIAQRWRVYAEDLILEWGPVSAASPGEGAEVRVVGGGNGGNWVAGFRRKGSRDWVQVRVRAGVVDRVPVAAREIARGALLAPEDVTVEEYADWGQPRDRPAATEIVGWRVNRRIRQGEVLQSPAIRPEDAVSSGSVIELVWAGRSVSVSVDGTAIGSGAVGDTIQVRVHDNKRVRAVIDAPGRARVIRPGFGG